MGNKATQRQTTNASTYKKQVIAKTELPSGAVVRIRNPGMDSFLRRGFIPDSLSPIIRKAVKGDKSDDNEMDDLFDDIGGEDSKMNELFGLLDAIVIDTWVEPEVLPIPESEEDRSDDLLYVDEVHFEDKNFTFQLAVGGTKDLETFRRQQDSMLARVSSGSDVESEAESTS